jgi:hypothetical protein
MMPTSFGPKPRPEFKVVGWRNKSSGAVQLPPPEGSGGNGAEAKLIEPPFNDVPSFDEELIPWE